MVELLFSKYLKNLFPFFPSLNQNINDIHLVIKQGNQLGDLFYTIYPMGENDLFETCYNEELEKKYSFDWDTGTIVLPRIKQMDVKEYCKKVNNPILNEMMEYDIDSSQINHNEKYKLKITKYYPTNESLHLEIKRQNLYNNYYLNYFLYIKNQIEEFCKNHDIHFIDDLGYEGVNKLVNTFLENMQKEEENIKKRYIEWESYIKDNPNCITIKKLLDIKNQVKERERERIDKWNELHPKNKLDYYE